MTPLLLKRLASWGMIPLLIVVILFALASWYVYVSYVKPYLSSYNANYEYKDSDGSKPTAEFIMFFVTWCPHCKNAKSNWEKFTEQYNGKTKHGYDIIVKKIDCTNENDAFVKQLQDKYNIEGYPTIVLNKNGTIIEFKADPTVYANLEDFVDKGL